MLKQTTATWTLFAIVETRQETKKKNIYIRNGTEPAWKKSK